MVFVRMALNTITPDFLDRLRRKLAPDVFREITQNYLEEPRRSLHGRAAAVLAPGKAEEVSLILKEANKARIGVVPYGGGTGLVGAQIYTGETAPLVLSLERMKAIRDVDMRGNVLVAEAGATLHEVHEAAEAVDRLFPLSLASEGSCQIGGNLATNAGGINVLRYGNMRDLCLGLEVVLPSGEIWNGLSRLRKDNTGYDLRHLLIGAEGTLGVITAASLKLFPRPAETATAAFVVPDPAAAIKLLEISRKQAGEAVSAFELIAGTGFTFLKATGIDHKPFFAETPEWSVLMDLGTSAGANAVALMESIFAEAFDAGVVLDGVIAASERQRQDLWTVRESIPEANHRIGAIRSHDISVPIASVPEFIAKTKAKFAADGDYRINCFGHLGDGNLHFNVFPPEGKHRDDYPAGTKEKVQRIVHDMVAEFAGSISAEHGIGRLKSADLQHYGDPAKLAAMRAIKAALDPNGIMNPGAIFGED